MPHRASITLVLVSACVAPQSNGAARDTFIGLGALDAAVAGATLGALSCAFGYGGPAPGCGKVIIAGMVVAGVAGGLALGFADKPASNLDWAVVSTPAALLAGTVVYAGAMALARDRPRPIPAPPPATIRWRALVTDEAAAMGIVAELPPDAVACTISRSALHDLRFAVHPSSRLTSLAPVDDASATPCVATPEGDGFSITFDVGIVVVDPDL